MSDILETFLEHWSKAEASERANAPQFLVELADLLDVPRPSNSHASGYTFEFPVRIPRGDGASSEGRIDLYHCACFVLEAKQFAAPKDEPTALSLVTEEAGLYATKKKSGPRSFRVRRADKVRERVRFIWLDPLSLDPAKRSAAVTREIAGYIATLATLATLGRAQRDGESYSK